MFIVITISINNSYIFLINLLFYITYLWPKINETEKVRIGGQTLRDYRLYNGGIGRITGGDGNLVWGWDEDTATVR